MKKKIVNNSKNNKIENISGNENMFRLAVASLKLYCVSKWAHNAFEKVKFYFAIFFRFTGWILVSKAIVFYYCIIKIKIKSIRGATIALKLPGTTISF